MRRLTLAVLTTLSAVVALFSYHTSTNSPGASAATGPTTGGGSTGASEGSSSSSKTFTGDSADTRWGPVQVAITAADGKITEAQAVVYPNGNGRDQEINAYAVPQLNSEMVAAQSADIDAVSGATVTSDGYLQSLQSALDQAGL